MRSFCVILLATTILMTAASVESEELPPAMTKCLDDMIEIANKAGPGIKECKKIRNQLGPGRVLTSEERETFYTCLEIEKSKWYPEVEEIEARCDAAAEGLTEAQRNRATELLRSRTVGVYGPP